MVSAEGLTLRKKNIKKLEATEMWFYRLMLRISWKDKKHKDNKYKHIARAQYGKRTSFDNCKKKDDLFQTFYEATKMSLNERHHYRKIKRQTWQGKTRNILHEEFI